MNILVTGASGFLGTTLCRHLELAGHQVVRLNSKNCDLCQEDSLYQLPQGSYDQIFHLAAWTQAGDFCLRHPGEQWLINQKINTNVLCWWKERQPQAKLICMGTSCAYDPNLPLTEANYLIGCPIESLFTYAMTKRMLYAGLLSLHKQFGLNYLCAVPSTLYGPGYHTDGRQMHFIFDVIRKILEAKNGGGRVSLWGDGYQKRELVYIDDFVNILLRLNETTSNALVNIGSGEEHTIRTFAEMICKQVHLDFSRVDFDTSKYVGAKSKILAVDYLKTLITDYPLTPLSTGLERTIAWFEATALDRAPRMIHV